ncbi:MAG: hypothetical protein HY811_06675 [Planctomycetes bacterium]|nr:hypothetical protein [Planctomycetota bacterium]
MPKRADWIPTHSDDFFNKQRAYLDLVIANKVVWGILDTAINPLLALQAKYEPLYWKFRNKKSRTGGDVAAHRDCRNRYQTSWRAFHNEWVIANPRVSKQDLVILVGPERDTKPNPNPVDYEYPGCGFKGNRCAAVR